MFVNIKKHKTLFGFLCLIWLLNLSDALISAYFVGNGLAEELNPIMLFLMDKSMVLFVAVKIILMTFVLAWIWRIKKATRFANFVTGFALILYGALFIYQIFHIIPLFFSQ